MSLLQGLSRARAGMPTAEEGREVLGVTRLSTRETDRGDWRLTSLWSPVISCICSQGCCHAALGAPRQGDAAGWPRTCSVHPQPSEAGDPGHINHRSRLLVIPGQVLSTEEKYDVQKARKARNSLSPHSVMRQRGLRRAHLSAGHQEDPKAAFSFCRSSGRWRDSPPCHEAGRSHLLLHLTRAAFTQELLAGVWRGNRHSPSVRPRPTALFPRPSPLPLREQSTEEECEAPHD